ncbi:MAG: S41 family peptidase [Balneolaceae bacterium]|nr:S41 family peptidase [Balneolaceae bacterium]MBO6545868.1 S41 family peptidase [Balneolaceae bacterium]MBO6647264.1 S41 family peptidase [Balneolaceae bacterium]
MRKILLTFCLTTFSIFVSAQEFDATSVVTELADLMNRNYVYPEHGEAMYTLLINKLNNGEYDQFETKKELASALDADLKSVVYDKHIRVSFDRERANRIQNRDPNGGREPLANSGFEKVEILEHNIGYLDLRGFVDIRYAEDDAIPAMDKLIQADAIIFDLRQNGGGSPSMIRFISSYIFGDVPVHLNTFYWRPGDSYSETWTNPEFASVRKPDIPVFVLTSDYTFSAAEEFTYNLKHTKRATIVGEVTGGGAHPGGPSVFGDGFIVNIPRGRAINPITKKNWEGVGVVPHILTSSEDALDKAIELAEKALNKN